MTRATAFLLAALVVGAGTSAAQQPPVATPAAPRVASTVTSPHGPALREPCASCHRADGWKPARISAAFRHAERTFPLTGAHERVQCQSCHKRPDFQGVSSNCSSCHADPHNNEFGVTCARCHNTRSFIDRGTAVRTHQSTRFPLRGAHAIATCEACHTRAPSGQAQFAARGTTCDACHLSTFRATRAPSHEAAHFSTNCISCHTISTWSGAAFDHAATRFPLTGRHQAATCEGCHADKIFAGKSTACASCHQADYAAAREPRHDPGFPTACATCHGTSQWKGAKFEHQTMTRFALTGRHVQATCIACHKNGVYQGTPSTCVSCHQTDFDGTNTPPHKAAGFAMTCESCHTTATWTGAQFDHATTRFALTGAHRAVSCDICHADKVYRGKSMLCASCHQAKADATTNPHHGPARFATTCESCHTTTAWVGARYDHNQTRFPLTGLHGTAVCLACHADKVYAGKQTTCVSCHQSNYDGTAQPNHRTLGFPTACESCHNTTQWDGAKFDHATNTRFELTGAHRTLPCRSCHADGVYRGKPMTCLGCHQGTYDATTSPHHAPAQFATTCESCHNTMQWKGVPYDHSKTAFPLLGKHVAAACLACHSDRVYKGKPTVCVSCHQRDYDASTQPNHRTSGIPTLCESCHTPSVWKPATFDHANTAFPLTGAHRAVMCTSCHADNVYKGKPTACASCHQAKYNATTNPHHGPAQFAVNCESCHTTQDWLSATYDHSKTAFPLLGRHLAAACLACHSDRVYAGKPSVCVACHQARYDASSNPNHRASGFPTTCETCHNAVAWTPASFDHAATRFPLVGAHRAVSCLGCHADGVYRGKTMVCVGCHQAKYNVTTAPNHAASSLPTTCESCHTSVAWTPATYDHSVTRFPLTGAHRTTTCLGCHGDGVYKNKPMTCASCHTTDYNATTNPNHRVALFPTTCESCHTTTQWNGATFNHDPWFPVYSGRHRGTWTSCTNCHTNSSTFKEFTCLSCHLKPKTDSQHQGRSGYQYLSTACYACHPRGTS